MRISETRALPLGYTPRRTNFTRLFPRVNKRKTRIYLTALLFAFYLLFFVHGFY